ncbi:uncharacterized protein ASCRUDRAFT_86767 [Ascoidea rubescens DSM 1968]|uniref:Uncharacterized protein n=1 Tax=Ascoidea rubescens DSM 1968 TaxID=1344418 RepID=A0A1D2VFS6_9ASCO|nr:hypothetical protein ASCRUDRAFT_86767 [Ascoidea rubescens DSM 1968]ODV60528.1 hypothetical protein ASCRUDRAFT_86767 [Ascoidea rubescens DSM 1968]
MVFKTFYLSIDLSTVLKLIQQLLFAILFDLLKIKLFFALILIQFAKDSIPFLAIYIGCIHYFKIYNLQFTMVDLDSLKPAEQISLMQHILFLKPTNRSVNLACKEIIDKLSKKENFILNIFQLIKNTSDVYSKEKNYIYTNINNDNNNNNNNNNNDHEINVLKSIIGMARWKTIEYWKSGFINTNQLMKDQIKDELFLTLFNVNFSIKSQFLLFKDLLGTVLIIYKIDLFYPSCKYNLCKLYLLLDLIFRFDFDSLSLRNFNQIYISTYVLSNLIDFIKFKVSTNSFSETVHTRFIEILKDLYFSKNKLHERSCNVMVKIMKSFKNFSKDQEELTVSKFCLISRIFLNCLKIYCHSILVFDSDSMVSDFLFRYEKLIDLFCDTINLKLHCTVPDNSYMNVLWGNVKYQISKVILSFNIFIKLGKLQPNNSNKIDIDFLKLSQAVPKSELLVNKFEKLSQMKRIAKGKDMEKK